MAQLRSRAVSDIEEALEFLLAAGRRDAAASLVDAIESAIGRLVRSPGSGSLRYAYELGFPDVRTWPVHRWQYVIFHVAHDDRVDILRVLHSKRDIPSTLVDEA